MGFKSLEEKVTNASSVLKSIELYYQPAIRVIGDSLTWERESRLISREPLSENFLISFHYTRVVSD